MPRRSALRALARHLGILSSYLDVDGRRHTTSDDTRVAIMHAMGVDAGDDAAARVELDRRAAEQRARLLDPVAVLTAGEPWALPVRSRGRGEWHATLALEDGTVHALQGTASARRGSIALPGTLPMGYHELRLSVRDAGGVREANQTLIVAPPRCTSVEERLNGTRAVGVLANLYSVRSARNWGCGDVGDLRQLAGWVAQSGGAFVGINPLHALRNRGSGVSPYSPVSRLFNNPIYLDVAALPELADAPEAAALMADAEFAATRDALRAHSLVDYEGVMRLKRRVLEPLHRAFARLHRDHDTPRGRAYRRYREAQGQALDRFAVFCALAERMSAQAGAGDWHHWPAPLRDPASRAVADFAAANVEAVDFHRYLQFALDDQLAMASDGLSLGVYRDLAVGSAADGCDTWAWPSLFARGASTGAPPDDFAGDGQNWGLPPIVPRALRDDRYRYWIRLLRAGFAHGGALRIDHVMGLFRLFWVPAHASARHGAYVRYPAEELLLITALESRRHQAVVVGENLGTVPPEIVPALETHGILSSAVMYFERGADGGFRPPAAYPAHALVSVGTHDHVPLAGFLAKRDIEIHRSLGLVGGGGALSRARAERDRARRALAARFEAEHIAGGSAAEPAAVVRAAHAFLGRTPGLMVGVSLDDLGLETDPVNVPGTTDASYPNWRRRMRLSLDEIETPAAAESLRAAGSGTEVEPRTPPSASPSRSDSRPAVRS